METLPNTDVYLRPVAEADLERIRAWRNSPEVAQWMYTEDEISPEGQRAWFAKAQNDPTRRDWVICRGNEPLGFANLANISPVLNSASFGLYLAPYAPKGQGIGAKGLFAVIEFGFNQVVLNKIHCEAFAKNDAALSLYDKLGFRREGYYREHLNKAGKPIDVVALAILRREWEQLREGQRARIFGSGTR